MPVVRANPGKAAIRHTIEEEDIELRNEGPQLAGTNGPLCETAEEDVSPLPVELGGEAPNHVTTNGPGCETTWEDVSPLPVELSNEGPNHEGTNGPLCETTGEDVSPLSVELRDEEPILVGTNGAVSTTTEENEKKEGAHSNIEPNSSVSKIAEDVLPNTNELGDERQKDAKLTAPVTQESWENLVKSGQINERPDLLLGALDAQLTSMFSDNAHRKSHKYVQISADLVELVSLSEKKQKTF